MARLKLAVALLTLLGPLAALAQSGVIQNWLLYFPSRATVAEMERDSLRAWPSGSDFRGLLAAPVGTAHGTVVVFHGNAGHAGHRGFYAAALLPLNLRVILAEYPGYGPRGGELGEASLVADAAQTIALAKAQFGAPLLVIGESLGAGVAAAAVARQRSEVDALVLITPWDRLENIANHHYPWLPVKWLLHDAYDSARHLAGSDRPVLVLVADHDTIVPAAFGQALYESLSAPKRLERLPGGHNDWPGRVDAAWWQRAVDFLLPQR